MKHIKRKCYMVKRQRPPPSQPDGQTGLQAPIWSLLEEGTQKTNSNMKNKHIKHKCYMVEKLNGLPPRNQTARLVYKVQTGACLGEEYTKA